MEWTRRGKNGEDMADLRDWFQPTKLPWISLSCDQMTCWVCPPLNGTDPSLIFPFNAGPCFLPQWSHLPRPPRQTSDSIFNSFYSPPQLNSFTMPQILFISWSLLLCPVPSTPTSFLDFGTSQSNRIPIESLVSSPCNQSLSDHVHCGCGDCMKEAHENIYHYLLKTFSGSQCPQLPISTSVLSCLCAGLLGYFPTSYRYLKHNSPLSNAHLPSTLIWAI